MNTKRAMSATLNGSAGRQDTSVNSNPRFYSSREKDLQSEERQIEGSQNIMEVPKKNKCMLVTNFLAYRAKTSIS